MATSRVYTVKVEDEDGRVIHTFPVDLEGPRGTNSEEAGLTDVEHALWVAAPAVCFFDCDGCR